MTFKWAIRLELDSLKKELEIRAADNRLTKRQRHALRLIMEYYEHTRNTEPDTRQVAIQDSDIQL